MKPAGGDQRQYLERKCRNNRGGQTGAACAARRWLHGECQQYHLSSTCACARTQKERCADSRRGVMHF